MSKFLIDNIVDIDENPFDRQERISWWSQEKLNNAKVMVVGAGAEYLHGAERFISFLPII